MSHTMIQGYREANFRIFRRFLRFGALAWGGPLAQIDMLRQELVEEEKWVTPEHFNRALAVYQALPGPEAHEMCVYFGMRVGGRLGGLLAGLGFMLPGFLLMFALSWMYVTFGANTAALAMLFYGCKPAVLALIVRAVHRIGRHALTDRWLLGIGFGAGAASLAGWSFLLTLPVAGVVYALVRRGSPGSAVHLSLFMPLSVLQTGASAAVPSLAALVGYGLRSGLLTFGGAYTVIPFLQHDAVVRGGWMTNAQFLDGLALGGILPAPLIIFSTFVGYVGGGPLGALALTAGIFLPAFAFTLIGHRHVERLIANQAAHAFLDGVTAGVVGLIAVTAIGLSTDAVSSVPMFAIFVLALAAAYLWKARVAVVGIMFGAGLLGWVFSTLVT
ncbi:MAG: chromate efflux transporter [Gemmatimonadaceae bacterium]